MNPSFTPLTLSMHTSPSDPAPTPCVSPNDSWLHRPNPPYAQWGWGSPTRSWGEYDSADGECTDSPPSSPSSSDCHSPLNDGTDHSFYQNYADALQEKLAEVRRELETVKATAAEAESLRAQLAEKASENAYLQGAIASTKTKYERHMTDQVEKCKAHYTMHYGRVVAQLQEQLRTGNTSN
ncbi:hypothetical protein KIPB_010237 [Kipferlia bialata]|uniref:Uncharacterized protein n=1 Tax=Kipferlia bialata TaxID=797122 RepID=A0A391NYH0_9EUKA|nr:hypothetical protein KIPB_010237 [Kipferlia bialata]|eukprot:g10237.t1